MRVCIRLAAAVLPVAVWAGQSLVLSPGVSTNGSVRDPFIGQTQSWRLEFQIHNWQLPSTDTHSAYIFNLYGVGVAAAIWPDGRLALTLWQNPVLKAQPCFLPLDNRSNVLVRLQRNITDHTVTCEMWNADGTGYQKDSDKLAGDRSGPTSGGDFGAAYTDTRLAFFRISRTLMPVGSSRPPITAETADWTELRFDGDLTDLSGNRHDISIVNPRFEPTPDQKPAAQIRTASAPGWTDWVSMRAGYPFQLDGGNSVSLNDLSASVTYQWSQVSGPSRVMWSDPSAASPTISGLIFGNYRFRLEVTDALGQKSAAEKDIGAVATDDNGVVVYPDPRLYTLLGPATIFGSNPWEWFDSRNRVMFEHWADQYEINGGPWRLESDQTSINGVPRLGTAIVAQGDSKLYGVGTNFTTVFCGGRPGPARPESYIVLRIPTANPNETPRPYPRLVNSCQSDTEITFAGGWVWERPGAPSPGLPWGTWNLCPDCGTWRGIFATSNINYYSNDLAHYALYYRSGWAKALNSARWLADRWYRSPWQLSFVATTPRDYALSGAYLRATVDPDGNPYDLWPSLRAFSDMCVRLGLLNKGPLDDVREQSYCLAYAALQAWLDPDPAQRQIAKTRVEQAYAAHWGPEQRPDGNYVSNLIEGDYERTFTVSQGSAVATRVLGPPLPPDYCGSDFTTGGTIALGADRVSITGTGTNFLNSAGKIIVLRGTLDGQPWSMTAQIALSPAPTATSLKLVHPWRGDLLSVSATQWRIYSDSIRGYYNMFFGSTNPDGSYPNPQVLDEDSWYWCTVTDPDHLKLDKPYTGKTAGGDIYRRPTWQNLTGRGSQPFMQGVAAWALNLAAKSLEDSNPAVSQSYRTAANRTVDWIWTFGQNPATKGLFYGVGFSNCRNLSILPAHECAQDSSAASNERAYNVETNSAFAQKYLNTLSLTDHDRGDSWNTAQFARDGFNSPFPGDGSFAELIDACCSFYNEKAYGQTFGIGQGHQWPAARLGGPAPAQPVKKLIDFDLSKVDSAVRVRIAVTQPSSAQTSFTCDQSPCEITLDSRQGAHWIQVQYLSAAGDVLAKDDPQLLPAS